jgi:hypothetical protein
MKKDHIALTIPTADAVVISSCLKLRAAILEEESKAIYMSEYPVYWRTQAAERMREMAKTIDASVSKSYVDAMRDFIA